MVPRRMTPQVSRAVILESRLQGVEQRSPAQQQEEARPAFQELLEHMQAIELRLELGCHQKIAVHFGQLREYNRGE